jgi:hypothetical protein
MSIARSNPKGLDLPSGRPLVVGISGQFPGTLTGEVYDPALNVWKSSATITDCDGDVGLAPLTDGRALAAVNGSVLTNCSAASLFDPTSETWTVAAAPGTFARFGGALLAALSEDRALLLEHNSVLPVARLFTRRQLVATARDRHIH